ncbi:hypothetical protein GCM10023201_40890 [Actinomycetospora corticicola]|uniref:Uncharacterized protein n=1 Tax=Actinomycetospora corticicola TaxID=663602 RepID=A0A7Y9DX63_9PSEU|nr:hypothetical protein [Actinomycetospora corticicola]NYD36827.1 hypothetical protein [Actinomycetospora corticicola]
MAWEFRRPLFDLQGALVVGIGAGDTQIRSSRFTSLGTDYSTGSYLPLTITDDTGSEVVWVTSHGTASDGVTVTRGREGTTARPFDSTAIVRCTPTLRDVVSAVANRSALPSDAHYGCRVLILNEGQVVERTSAGWNDSAPLEDDATRKHRWNQSGATVNAPGGLISGLSGGQTNTTGTLATMSGGALSLNAQGMWSLGLAMYGTSQSARNEGVEMRWPGGAFPGGIGSLFDVSGAQGGTSPSGNALHQITWTGYVPSGSVGDPISMYASTTVTLVGCVFDVFAEYLGR